MTTYISGCIGHFDVQPLNSVSYSTKMTRHLGTSTGNQSYIREVFVLQRILKEMLGHWQRRICKDWFEYSSETNHGSFVELYYQIICNVQMHDGIIPLCLAFDIAYTKQSCTITLYFVQRCTKLYFNVCHEFNKLAYGY